MVTPWRGGTVEQVAAWLRERMAAHPGFSPAAAVDEMIRCLSRDLDPVEQRLAEIRRVLEALDQVTKEDR